MVLYGCMAPGGRRDSAWHLYGAIQLYGKLYGVAAVWRTNAAPSHTSKVRKFHEIAKWHLKLQCNYTEITLQLKLHKLSLAEAAAALPPPIR